MLEIRDLHKSYGDNEVLKGIDLSVRDGEILGFIGHNGAGKTTTIKCVTGLLEFERGQILIDGVDIKADPLGVKSKTAYLPDNPDLYENLTGMEFLNFVSDVFGIDSDTRLQRIEQLGKELEIYDYLGDRIKGLSHGQKQKVAVISALVHEPKLLVMDEPFVGLDPKSTYIVKQKLRELCSRGSTIFFSSHVLEIVENLCDRVIILNHGRIVMEGTVNEIKQSGETLEQVFLSLEDN